MWSVRGATVSPGLNPSIAQAAGRSAHEISLVRAS